MFSRSYCTASSADLNPVKHQANHFKVLPASTKPLSGFSRSSNNIIIIIVASAALDERNERRYGHGIKKEKRKKSKNTKR